MKDYVVRRVTGKYFRLFITTYHYSQRAPSISYAFGLFSKDDLLGVITYGVPPSPTLQTKIPYDYLELSRVAMKINEKNIVSWFMARTFKMLPTPILLISFADPNVNHVGYIYQSTNWIYTGITNPKNEYVIDGVRRHARHIGAHIGSGKNVKKLSEIGKHRYFLPLGSKTSKKKMRQWVHSNYKVQDYPKGESVRYDMRDEREKLKELLDRKNTLF